MNQSEDKVKLKKGEEKQDMLLATELCCGGFQLDGKVCWLSLNNDIENPSLGGNNIFCTFIELFIHWFMKG